MYALFDKTKLISTVIFLNWKPLEEFVLYINNLSSETIPL